MWPIVDEVALRSSALEERFPMHSVRPAEDPVRHRWEGARRGGHALSPYLTTLCLVALASCSTSTTRLGLPPLQTVSRVELSRYLGTWYEIASIPQHFQSGCTGTRATYSLRSDGEIAVVNRCFKGSLEGVEDVATGRARVTDTATNAKLEVNFFGPFWGPYWVIQLGDEYEYAVVGHPDRDFLWVLSRTPVIDSQVYAGILARLSAEQYPLDRLVLTTQPRQEESPLSSDGRAVAPR